MFVVPRLAAVLATLLFAISGPAAELTGRIADAASTAIPGALVRVLNRNGSVLRVVRADADGSFSVADLSPGEYRLELSAPGFDLQSVPLSVTTADQTLREDVRLSIGALRTAVQVTAAGTALTVDEIAKAEDAVRADEMMLRDEYSLAEGLRLLPGVAVQQQGGPGNFTAVRVRGLRSQDTALLFDGLRVRDAADPQGGSIAFMEALNMVDSSAVEMLRGSGSSLYGSHAIGGVMNVRAEEGGGPWRGQVLTEGGGLGFLRGLARASGGFGDRLLLSGGLSHLNVRHGVDGANPHRNTSGQGWAKYLFAPSIAATARFTGLTAYSQLADSPSVDAGQLANLPASGVITARALPDAQLRLMLAGMPYSVGNSTFVPSLNDPDSRRTTNLVNLATAFSQELSARASYRVAYQLTDSKRAIHDGPGGQLYEPLYNSRSDFDGRIHLLQARTDLQVHPSHLVTASYEREHESILNSNLDQDPNPATRTNNALRGVQQGNAFSVQDQMQFLDGRLRVNLSGRTQSFVLDTPRFEGGASPYQNAGQYLNKAPRAWTGDASVAYMVASTNTKFRAHVGNAYRAPSVYERFGASYFFGSFSPSGDPRLNPERALSGDAGIDQWWFGDKLQTSATIFYTRLQNTIIFDFSGLIPPDDPFGRFGGYANTKGGLSRGVELSVRARPGRGAVVQASYTYQNADERSPVVAGSGYLPRMNVSPHLFSALWSQPLGDRFTVTTDLSYASEYPMAVFAGTGSRVYLMEGPLKIDTVADYAVRRWETGSLHLYGKVENWLDRQFYEGGFRGPGRWALAGLRVQF